MYAVIETGGKQYRVAVGDKLKVEQLAADEGTSISLPRVLMVADGEDIQMGTPLVEVAVSATVLSHGRGRKIRVFKMKRRKHYQRTQGHRQSYTEIQITAIGGKGDTAAAHPATLQTQSTANHMPDNTTVMAEPDGAAPPPAAATSAGAETEGGEAPQGNDTTPLQSS